MHDAQTVRHWIAQAEAEVSMLTQTAESIQIRLADARRRLMLLYEGLATVTSSPVPVASNIGVSRSVREEVRANVEKILRENGKPMRLQDVHAEFIRRGMALPGRGNPTNILAHLSPFERILRMDRGVYGLAEWDLASDSAKASPIAAASLSEVATKSSRDQTQGRRRARN